MQHDVSGPCLWQRGSRWDMKSVMSCRDALDSLASFASTLNLHTTRIH